MVSKYIGCFPDTMFLILSNLLVPGAKNLLQLYVGFLFSHGLIMYSKCYDGLNLLLGNEV